MYVIHVACPLKAAHYTENLGMFVVVKWNALEGTPHVCDY